MSSSMPCAKSRKTRRLRAKPEFGRFFPQTSVYPAANNTLMATSSTPESRQVSEIDRLIELATDKPAASASDGPPAANGRSPHRSLPLEERKDTGSSMWRLLLQLRTLVPHLARILPLLERAVLGTNVLSSSSQANLDTSRFDRGIEGLHEAHRDLTTQLKNQATDIKQLQEQMTWLSRSLELETQRQEEISEGVAALRRLVRAWGIVFVVLLALLIGAVVFLALSRAG